MASEQSLHNSEPQRFANLKLWAPDHPFKVAFLFGFAVMAIVFLVWAWTGIGQYWLSHLLSEVSAVGFGITMGACVLDFNYSKPERLKTLRKRHGHANLRSSLGFFHSRIAMRSQELFEISIAAPTMTRPAAENARTLVKRYWAMAGKPSISGSTQDSGTPTPPTTNTPKDESASLKILRCAATPTSVIVYFSQPLDDVADSNPASFDNYEVHTLRPAKEPELPITGNINLLSAASYDVIHRAAILRLTSVLTNEQWLAVTVRNVRSGGSPIDPQSMPHKAQVGATVPPEAKDEETKKAHEAKKAEADKEQLRKILQPEYAIGMGLITSDDLDKLKNEFLVQSQLAVGLYIPMILIVLGIALTPNIAPQRTFWAATCLALALISTVLFLIGAERYQKYRMESKLLILGNWEKKQADAKNQKSTAAPDSKQIQKAVANALNKVSSGTVKLNVNS